MVGFGRLNVRVSRVYEGNGLDFEEKRQEHVDNNQIYSLSGFPTSVISCRRIFLCLFLDLDPLFRICSQLRKEGR